MITPRFSSTHHFPEKSTDRRLLCDTERQIGMAYGACENHQDKSAKRISYVIGPDGTIRHAFPKVDARSHPRDVLTLLGGD